MRAVKQGGLVAAAALLAAGCGGWQPFVNVGGGEGLQISGPDPLDIEQGISPHDPFRGPKFVPSASPIRQSLEVRRWAPLPLPTRAGRCYAVRVSLDEGVESRFEDHARRAQATLVLRDPAGEVVARIEAHHLGRCNWEGHAAFTLDLVADKPLAFGPIGRGALLVQLFERPMTKAEHDEEDARAMPLLAGGGVALRDPEKVRVPKNVRATRRLEAFEPVPLGFLEAEHCDSVRIVVDEGGLVNPAARVFDAPFRFQEARGKHLAAQRVVDGRLVSEEICNPSGDRLEVSLVLERRPGAPEPGSAVLRIEAFTRPFRLAAPGTPFLDGGVLGPTGESEYEPGSAAEERRLEAFEPLSVDVAAGRCAVVKVTRGPDAVIARAATMYSHFFVFRDLWPRGGRPSAITEEAGKIVSRAFCYAGGGSATWPLVYTLVSRDGRPPGRGMVTVQILTRQMKPEEY